MEQSKGMSQVLSLIVAAMVFMMIGLTLTVITQGSITDLLSGSESQSCYSTLQASCVSNSGEVNIPPSCDGITDKYRSSTDTLSAGGTIACSAVNG